MNSALIFGSNQPINQFSCTRNISLQLFFCNRRKIFDIWWHVLLAQESFPIDKPVGTQKCDGISVFLMRVRKSIPCLSINAWVVFNYPELYCNCQQCKVIRNYDVLNTDEISRIKAWSYVMLNKWNQLFNPFKALYCRSKSFYCTYVPKYSTWHTGLFCVEPFFFFLFFFLPQRGTTKVIIYKSRGGLSLLVEPTIDCVPTVYF